LESIAIDIKNIYNTLVIKGVEFFIENRYANDDYFTRKQFLVDLYRLFDKNDLYINNIWLAYLGNNFEKYCKELVSKKHVREFLITGDWTVNEHVEEIDGKTFYIY
jgi:hypothetical protein